MIYGVRLLQAPRKIPVATSPNRSNDIIDHTLGRVLDLFDIDAGKVKRWS